jgi:ribosomal protein S18 acetylase RimI-like enzyme
VAHRGLRPHREPEARVIRVRRAGERDLPGILALMRPYYAEDGYSFEPRRAARVVRTFLRRPSWGRAWVAAEGSRVAGYCVVTLGYSLEYGGRDAFVDEIVVAPEDRGRGLGARLIAEAVAYCRAQGVAALHLEVERHRRAAAALYRKAGFSATGRMLLTRRIRG